MHIPFLALASPPEFPLTFSLEKHALVVVLAIPAILQLVQAQLIDLDKINAYPDPVLVSAPLGVEKDTPPDQPNPPVTPIETATGTVISKATPTARLRRVRRSPDLSKRDGNCSPQPTGAGPVPSPDTDAAFLASGDVSALANNGPMPDGYAAAFTNQHDSLNAPNYMGLTTLDSYDTLGCASLCDQAAGCAAFNIYVERDPSKDPNAQNCPNPPSTSNFKCTLWGVPVSQSETTNTGNYRDDFHVVIAGSNGYNKTAAPAAVSGFTGPTELDGAINAPLDYNGYSTYMGYRFFPFSQAQGYVPQTCASACKAQSTYNSQHANADGSYQTCVFFNAYVLSENAVPQGLYCSLYNQTWPRSYGTNYGQNRGSDRYTVSRSYSYALTNPPNPSTSQPQACLGGASLVNPSFEDPTNPYPYGWTVQHLYGSTSYGLTGSPNPNAGAGTSALFMGFNGGGSGVAAQQLGQAAQTCTGTTYRVSFDYRLSFYSAQYSGKDPYADCTLQLITPKASGGTSQVVARGGSYDNWATLAATFTAPAKTSQIDIVIQCSNSYYYLVDNVQIKQA